MQMKAMIKGISAGLAVGTMCYVIAGTTSKQKRRMKKRTGHALRTVGAFMEGFSEFIS